MTKQALLFGSIGAIAETSDIQRRAYNAALREQGLHWEWDRATYTELLEQAGGKDRLSLLSRATNAGLDEETINTIHAHKTKIACEEVRAMDKPLRPGVAALVAEAKERGMKLAFVTSTYRANIDAIFEADNGLTQDDFDVIVVRDDVENGKPAPDVYEHALAKLGVNAADAIAIEDTTNSVLSARRAGVPVIATRGAFTAEQDVSAADLVLDALGTDTTVNKPVLEMLD